VDFVTSRCSTSPTVKCSWVQCCRYYKHKNKKHNELLSASDYPAFYRFAASLDHFPQITPLQQTYLQTGCPSYHPTNRIPSTEDRHPINGLKISHLSAYEYYWHKALWYLYFKIGSVCLSVPWFSASINPLYPATDCAAATDISDVSGRWQLSS